MTDTYRVDVAPIFEVLGESIGVSGDLPLDTLQVGAETFAPTGPAHFDVTITNTGTAIIAMGSVSLPVTATCARCLCEFPTEISGEVDGFYVRPGHDKGLPEEQEIEYIDAENHVDILPAVMAALVLEAPFAPLHDEECAGICPSCGADLNSDSCSCAENPGDSGPFSALQGLLRDRTADGA